MNIIMEGSQTGGELFMAETPTTYQETMLGGTLFRITSTYLGKVDLASALEELTVKKILMQENEIRGCNFGSDAL